MRCTACDYPLTNLTARACPECGKPFKLSEMSFVIGSVRFCCPHCDQSYYGTGFQGHLTPVEFDCVKCGRHIHMDETVIRLAVGVTESQARPSVLPWEEARQGTGFMQLMRTTGMAMVTPLRLISAASPDLRLGKAWSYATLVILFAAVVGIGLPLGGLGLFVWLGGDRGGLDMMMAAPILTAGMVVGQLIFIAIWGLLTHGLLRISGGCRYSLGRTIQAMCYSSGAMLPAAVPCLGWYCGSSLLSVWWVVCAVLMVAEGQKVHGGRATFATLTPPVVITGALFVLYFGAIFIALSSGPRGMMGTMGATATTTSFSDFSQTFTMLQAVQDHAEAHQGQGPGHAVELLVDSRLWSYNFESEGTATVGEDLIINGEYLSNVEMMDSGDQAAYARSAAASLPSDVVAHRVGDFVFTYHGMNLRQRRQLWVVILWPDPDLNGPDCSITPHVGYDDGSVMPMPCDSFDAALADQNALRATVGLPPLPHPSAVTDAQPARASAPPARPAATDAAQFEEADPVDEAVEEPSSEPALSP